MAKNKPQGNGGKSGATAVVEDEQAFKAAEAEAAKQVLANETTDQPPVVDEKPVDEPEPDVLPRQVYDVLRAMPRSIIIRAVDPDPTCLFEVEIYGTWVRGEINEARRVLLGEFRKKHKRNLLRTLDAFEPEEPAQADEEEAK